MNAPEQHPPVPTNTQAHDQPAVPTQPKAKQHPPNPTKTDAHDQPAVPTQPEAKQHPPNPNKRKAIQQPTVSATRKAARDSVPPIRRDRTPSEGPSEDSTVVSDMDDSSDGDPSYLDDLNPMNSTEVLMLARELFAHLAPYSSSWSRARRLKIGSILVDLGYLLMPGVYD
ncbi:hypothetical protein CF319_g5020 [Tilletia indica]|uniref:Uncharacterized protein n=1 Tax=Tilletia indica TaxID=43049 RepID=A0A177TCU7_9BASI|nr:hypothetical protein CF319_g5020 [Tilletia indica]KAE8250756.1 hypothetical protein A4X13_0g4412 [Tilletia indica]